MSDNGKTLEEHREACIDLDEQSRILANRMGALAQRCEQLRVQTELATKSMKRARLFTNPYWLILPALLGGLIGGSLAAMINILTRV